MKKYEIERWITKNGVHIPILRQPKFKGYTAKQSRQILKDSKKGNESHLAHEQVKKLARMYHINLSVEKNSPVDDDVLISQVQALRDIADEFPQVEKLMKHNGQQLAITVEAFKASNKIGEHNADTADADTDPSTNTISLNTKSVLFKSDLKTATEQALKHGTKHKWGNSILSTDNLEHTVVHEFGHVLQNVLADKLKDSKSEIRDEIMQIAMGKCGLKEKPRNISVYANKSTSELISECIADAYLNKSNANEFSKQVYKYMKRQLG